MNYLFFLPLWIMTSIITVNAIKCYECTHCLDISKSTNVIEKDCPESPTGAACLKISYVLSNYTTGVRARSCSVKSLVGDERAVPKAAEAEQEKSPVYVKFLNMYYCDTDFCNGSNSLFPRSLNNIIIIVSFISLIFNIHQT